MPNIRYDITSSALPRIQAKLLYITAASYGDDWHSTMHNHPFAELFYVTRGNGKFLVNSEVYNVKEDDMVVVNANVTHTEARINDEPFEYIAMGIDGVAFNSLGSHFDSNVSIHNYHDYKHEILFYIKVILSEASNQEENYQEICNKLLDILIINMLRRTNIALEVKPEEFLNKHYHFVKQYIDNNFHKEITLDHLAELTHTSKYYLAHVFKRDSGFSPIQYLNHVRLSEAQKMLINTDYSITQISQLLGYSTPSYFSQAFSNKFKRSPLDYRKHYKEGQMDENRHLPASRA